ncbi:MAG: alpha/beta fold hydrolase [Deltaproteobacteria bacterium]|nr:alpha/beta fold hydrolase [Deltaproteobacteria bacterium]MBW1874564.1 alpha/beta fold hydrolase [Deltaproteobacteria bacterium]MBW2209934.1 alpha/beta fold hydrolase [Deltaproteobacteria bacterium]MBW2213011.1 alpha/beta fold hydrolase [Deltaproteobacteria bacterium]MBW2380345.1 alpha/beta fold hydrolase [Deltaproteobacteria bacterium]
MVVEAVPEGEYADVGNGITMHYHEAGSGDRGVILFVHGSGPGASGWSNFKGNYPFLAEHGYRTIVPDTMGYGYSTKPEEGAFSLDDVAAQYKALLDTLAVDRAIVVGNSQGGAIAITMALNYPDLVDKLVLMAPGGLEARETYMQMEGIKAMIRVLYKEGISKETMRKVFTLQLQDESKITDEVIEERYQVAMTQHKDNIARIQVTNLEERLSEIQCPVLCFWGANDKFCPSTGASKIATSCPNSRTMLIANCGHWVMVEYQELFNNLTLSFLDNELG